MTEWIEEDSADGFGVVRRKATRWRNSTNVTVHIRGIRDAEAIPAKTEGGPFQPARILNYAIRPGEEVLIPSEHDQSIHNETCVSPVCGLYRRCKDPTHGRLVVGGLGTMLERVGSSEPPRFHPVVVPLAAPAPPKTIDDADARLMRRASQRAAAQ
jgi:hypothetical protein